jgi:RPA family protein
VPIDDPHSFYLEARFQRVCAVTGKSGEFEAHHTIKAQTLRQRGLPTHDPRGALRLTHRAHEQHTNRVRVVKTKELTSQNILYAFEVLGPFAADYLVREYDDQDPDPRIVEAAHAA